MTPWKPGAVACQACLAILLLGHEVTELIHSSHVCGSPQQDLCVDEPGSRPHFQELLGTAVPPPDPFPPRVTVRPARTVDARGTVYTPVTVRVPVG